ncbi:MAG: leucine-rich repeat protein [Intestinibacter sp.]|uniref:leucine-rich repeat protein n=1 Tax=Intestinibacter sp. TaxID=1965304 RepID=UPI003F155789
MIKKILSIGLSFALVLSYCSMDICAAELSSYTAQSSLYPDNFEVIDNMVISDGILYDYQRTGEDPLEINVPEGVTTIKEGAFSYLNVTYKITLPSTLRVIEDRAFEYCRQVKKVEFKGDTLDSIGEGVFSNCMSLYEVKLPSKLSFLGDNMFCNCALKTVDLPDTMTSIAPGAFCYNPLTSVTGGSNVNDIGNNAFYECENLEGFNLAEGLTSIGKGAFQYCKALKNIVIPSSVITVGDGAFFSTAIDNLSIGPNLKNIGKSAFCDTKIKEITIPNTVENLGSSAFAGCSLLEKATVEEGITSIPNSLFASNQKLTEVYLPDSLESMGSAVFEECLSLTKVDLPNKLKEIPDNTFKNCSELQSVSIGDEVTKIGANAFFWCSKLSDINMPSKLESIGNQAFRLCTNISQIQLPESVYSLGNGAFDDCSSLKSINIPEKVTKISSSLFEDCESLTEIILPESVDYIGGSAFSRCYSLKTINIRDDISYFGGGVFNECKSLTYVNIPKTIDKLGDNTFSGCESLTSITVPENVTEIGSSCFSNCRSLKTINLPKNLKVIKHSVFDGCSSLEYIELPDTLERLDPCFYRTGIRELTIPSKISKLGTYFISGCKNLQKVVIPKTVTTIEKSAISECSPTLYVYKDSEGERYAKESNFNYKYLDKINISDIEFEAIPAQNYTGKSLLPKVTPIGVTLTEDKDYTISYKNNVNPGIATITIVGINDYIGEKTINFEIKSDKPASPVVTAKSTSSTITLSWDKVENATGYKIYKYNTTTNKYVLLKTTSDLSYVNTNLTSASSYKYRVRAYKEVNGSNLYSDYTYLTTATNPLKPKVSYSSRTTTSIKLKWSKVNRADGYKIYVYDSSIGTYRLLDTIEGNSQDTVYYTATNLKTGKNYTFKVKAYKNAEDGEHLSYYSDSVKNTTKPSAPVVSVKSTYRNAIVSYPKVSYATGYEVKMATSRYGTYSTIYTGSKLSYTKTGLKKDTTRYFKVRAYKVLDGVKVYSSYSNIVSVKIK